MKKCAFINCDKPKLIVGLDIPIDDIMSCDIIIWNYLGLHGIISEAKINNVKELLIDLAPAADLMNTNPPELYFEWSQTTKMFSPVTVINHLHSGEKNNG